jgi:Uma2 family endonuclease
MDAQQDIAYYTFKDYLTWPDNPRYELIDGVPQMMAGASDIHQEILLALGSQFRTFLKGKQCRVFVSPYDVRLNENDFDDTVVQPDVFVVCDRSKITRTYLNGTPDLAIEVLSPTSGRYDRIVKFKRYQRAGISEYWVVDPADRSVHVYILNESRYISFVYEKDEKIPVHVLPGCEIDLADVFPPKDENAEEPSQQPQKKAAARIRLKGKRYRAKANVKPGNQIP